PTRSRLSFSLLHQSREGSQNLRMKVLRRTVKNRCGLSSLVEEKHFGHATQRAKRAHRRLRTQNEANRQIHRGGELSYFILRRFNGYRYNRQVIAVALLDLSQPTQRCSTWRTPGCPKLNHYNLSRQLGQG